MRIPQFGCLSARTARLLAYDLIRVPARWRHRRRVRPASDRLHLGCGSRRVPGWLNVDVWRSDYDVDLACGRLPWLDASFSVVVSQHVIEHLELDTELLPLLRELRRVVKPNGELWLSCPDLETVCHAYINDRASALLADRVRRMPSQGLNIDGMPSQHFVNWLFHQAGEHKNLFDMELLTWAVQRAGFTTCTRVDEATLLRNFPEFPARHDDLQSIAVLVT